MVSKTRSETIGWQLATYQSVLAEADEKTGIVHRKTIIKKQLKTIMKLTKSNTKTPGDSLSRNLQLLRDFGFIKFVKNGKYKLIKKEIDMAIFNSNKKMSRREKLVAQILDELNIPYRQEATHTDLKYKGYLRFDFEINHRGRKFVIEVDGVQHDRPVDYFGGIDAFVVRKKCDEIKDDYCERTGRTMIRIKAKDLTYDKVKKKIVKMLEVDNNDDIS